MSQNVQFVYLAQSEYDGLSAIQDSRIYFTSDTHRIYRGTTLYATTSLDDLQFSGGGQIQVGDSGIQIGDSQVSLEGHTHSLSDINGWEDANIEFTNLSVSTITVEGKQVSLEGHVHTLDQLVGLSEATLSISGIAASTIVASQIFVGANAVSLEGHTHSIDELTGWADTPIEIGELEVSSMEVSNITVGGNAVSLEGHTHSVSDILDWDEVDIEFNSLSVSSLQVSGQPVALEGHGHSLSEISDISGANLSLGDVSANIVSASTIQMNGQTVSVEGHAHPGNLAIIKPYSDNPLFIDLEISTSPSFTTVRKVGSESRPELFLGFDSQNWVQPSSSGFGVQFNDSPITFKLKQYLNGQGVSVSDNDTFYIRYCWYWKDEDSEKHNSDTYSLVYPTATEVGANSRDVTSRREFQSLDSEFHPLRTTTYADNTGFFHVYRNQFNEFGTSIGSGARIILKDYAFSNRYQMRFFTTSGSSEISIRFYTDIGNGAEYDSSLAINHNSFLPNTQYTIEVKNDTLIVHSVGGEDLARYIQKNSTFDGNISMIRPLGENPQFIELDISFSPDFSTPHSISSEASPNLFYGFNSTSWVVSPSTGFGNEFCNQPISFRLGQYLSSQNIVFGKSDTLYIRYSWYWKDSESVKHDSDTYSMVYPTSTEVGANSRDVVSRSRFDVLDQDFRPVKTATSWNNYVQQMFEVYTYQFNEFAYPACDNYKVLLKNYNFSNGYQMKFQTSGSSNISLKFYVDRGNGPEYDSTLAINTNSFIPNVVYVIEIKNDVIIVNSINGKDLLTYTAEMIASQNSSSVNLRIWED